MIRIFGCLCSVGGLLVFGLVGGSRLFANVILIEGKRERELVV